MIEKAGDREGMNVGKDFTEHGEGTCGLVSGNGIVSAENTATAGIYETLIFNYLRRENAILVSFFAKPGRKIRPCSRHFSNIGKPIR